MSNEEKGKEKTERSSFTGMKPEAEPVRCKQLQNKHELHVNNKLLLQESVMHPHRPGGILDSLMCVSMCVHCLLGCP